MLIQTHLCVYSYCTLEHATVFQNVECIRHQLMCFHFHFVHRERHQFLSLWSWCRWCPIANSCWWELTPYLPLYTISILWNTRKHPLCKSAMHVLFISSQTQWWWFILSWLLYVGLHKWDSFIPISIYFLFPSNVSICQLPTDCSILGWCGHHTVWQHFLQRDIWFWPSSKSPWSTTRVIFILWQLYSKHTVDCDMG